MLRRNTGERSESRYTKSPEGKERGLYKWKQEYKESLKEGKPIHTELKNEEASLRNEIDLEDENNPVPRIHINDEYANAALKDSKIHSTTSSGPNQPLTQSLKIFHWPTFSRLMLSICWHSIHLLISITHVGSKLIQVLTCYLISIGLLKRYQVPQLDKLRYLAIVVDNEEAKYVMKIRELLNWLSGFGINHVIFYDMQGVCKNSELILKGIRDKASIGISDTYIKASVPFPHTEKMSVEMLSLSDGKEMVAKAANFLYMKHLVGDNLCQEQEERIFTEVDMENALEAVGGGGPQVDLLLVFGPARCHLGFPAWRMRYTEIVHMGSLKFLQYGAVVKAIHDFSVKNQNYGS